MPLPRRVFISYSRHDSDAVTELVGHLESLRVPVWFDRDQLKPGDEWMLEIRRAIEIGSIAFLAVFSHHSTMRDASVQNRELYLAATEMTKRAPGYTWLIPVRLDECVLPSIDIGGGRTISDLQWVDLFGARREHNLERLASLLAAQFGDATLSAGEQGSVSLQAERASDTGSVDLATQDAPIAPSGHGWDDLDSLVAVERRRSEGATKQQLLQQQREAVALDAGRRALRDLTNEAQRLLHRHSVLRSPYQVGEEELRGWRLGDENDEFGLLIPIAPAAPLICVRAWHQGNRGAWVAGGKSESLSAIESDSFSSSVSLIIPGLHRSPGWGMVTTEDGEVSWYAGEGSELVSLEHWLVPRLARRLVKDGSVPS